MISKLTLLQRGYVGERQLIPQETSLGDGLSSPAGALRFPAQPQLLLQNSSPGDGYNQGRHRPAVGLALLRALEGNPETSCGGADGLGRGDRKEQKLSSRNNIKNGLLKKLPFKNKRQKTFVTDGCQGRGQEWGHAGTPLHSHWASTGRGLSPAEHLTTGSHTRLCIPRRGLGWASWRLAATSPQPQAESVACGPACTGPFGGQRLGGNRCQAPGYSQCL